MLNNGDLLNVIKRAAMEAVRASKPVTVTYGTIILTEPLTIQLDQKITLTEDFLIVTKEIRKNLKKGPVVLIREQGGQKYVILGTL